MVVCYLKNISKSKATTNFTTIKMIDYDWYTMVVWCESDIVLITIYDLSYCEFVVFVTSL